MKRKKITELPLTQVAEMYGKDSLDVSQEETLEQILETATMELFNLAYALGKLSEALEIQLNTVMRIRKLLQLSYREEVDGDSGPPVQENSDSGERT